jgi:hypothetical protein
MSTEPLDLQSDVQTGSSLHSSPSSGDLEPSALTQGDATAWDCETDGHDYEYEPGERAHFCRHCGAQPPPDWYAMEDDV